MFRSIFAAAFVFAASATAASADLPGGTYTRGSFPGMSFVCPAQQECIGYYRDEDGGQSYVYLRGNPGTMVFTGYWAEPSSDKDCGVQEFPDITTPHWGRVELKFDASANSWSGHWWYCNENSGGGGWTGER